jgi:hypothetical protein
MRVLHSWVICFLLALPRVACGHASPAGSPPVGATAGATDGFDSGFEGTLTLITTHSGATPVRTSVKVRKGRLRVDTLTTIGAPVTALYIPEGSHVILVLPQHREIIDFVPPEAIPPMRPQASKKDTVRGVACEFYSSVDLRGVRTESCLASGLPYVDLEFVSSGRDASSGNASLPAGFPLREARYDAEGNVVSRTEVSSIDPGPIDEDLFAVPRDYVRASPAGDLPSDVPY